MLPRPGSPILISLSVIDIEISSQLYKAKTLWHEITLDEFIRVISIDMPEKLVDLYSHLNDDKLYSESFDKIGFEDSVKIFPEYYGKIIAILTDIPQEIIDLISWEYRTSLYYKCFHPVCLSGISSAPLSFSVTGKVESFEPEEVESFTFEDEKYFLPKSLRISGMSVPMAGEPIITFTEASDILATWHKASEKVVDLAMIAAIYCRKEGEKYSQEIALARAEKFKKLPMSVIWRLFFCITRLTGSLLKDIPAYLLEIGTRKQQMPRNRPGLIVMEAGGYSSR